MHDRQIELSQEEPKRISAYVNNLQSIYKNLILAENYRYKKRQTTLMKFPVNWRSVAESKSSCDLQLRVISRMMDALV